MRIISQWRQRMPPNLLNLAKSKISNHKYLNIKTFLSFNPRFCDKNFFSCKYIKILKLIHYKNKESEQPAHERKIGPKHQKRVST